MNQRLNSGITAQLKSSAHRREDAAALLQAGRWRGAMYVAGYVVESLLKARLMRRFDCLDLRELEAELRRRELIGAGDSIFTHRLERLLRLIDGYDRLRSNQKPWRQFSIVNAWAPAWRYAPDLSSAVRAEEYLAAVDDVKRWIENNT